MRTQDLPTNRTTLPTPVIRDRLLNRNQVAETLGISTRTLDRLVSQGLLEKVFVGASPRFRASDIAAIIENGL